MPKRKKSSILPIAVIALAVVAGVIFGGGEAWRRMREGRPPITVPRWLRHQEPAAETRDMSRQIRRALAAAGVPDDSVHESVLEHGPAAVRWRVGVRPDASLLQINYAVTHLVQDAGGAILHGREEPGAHGETRVDLLVGVSGRATHDIVLMRGAPLPAEERAIESPGKIAIVLYGIDEIAAATRAFALHVPFAVALAPGGPASGALFRAAHQNGREVVLYLPLEPINYPQVDPGPGALLVSMRPAQISGLVRRYLDQAGPVAAVANKMGSLATQDMSVMGAVAGELQRHHLPFIHVLPVPGAVCKTATAGNGVIYTEPDAVIEIDSKRTTLKALDKKWDAVLERARARATTMVWVRDTELTRGWLPGAVGAKRLHGLHLAPVTAVIRKPTVL